MYTRALRPPRLLPPGINNPLGFPNPGHRNCPTKTNSNDQERHDHLLQTRGTPKSSPSSVCPDSPMKDPRH